MSKVLGVIVIARNGDRYEYFQDPDTYAAGSTETTALGEVQSHALGALLRSTYFSSSSSSFIENMSTDLVDNKEVKVRVKAGAEGTVVFDSTIALLQGLFPPNPKNKIVLANGEEVVAPLGGYQYVPVETVEPSNDRSLESWTECPAFTKHIAGFYASDEFKAAEKSAQPLLAGLKDFVFGRETSLKNMWNIHDFVSSQLMHNQTYAYRLPPTFAEQTRAFANFHENGVFSDKEHSGIGNIAGRTLLHVILSALERIAFNGDPLQFMLVETSYQPFISLFHEMNALETSPKLGAIPDFASALTIELRRGSPPDVRDFLRFKFRNGTQAFENIHVFGHRDDIPLTEFIYRAEGSAITSNAQWRQVCQGKGVMEESSSVSLFNVGGALLGVVMFLLFGVMFKFMKKRKERKVQLAGPEVICVSIEEKGFPSNNVRLV